MGEMYIVARTEECSSCFGAGRTPARRYATLRPPLAKWRKCIACHGTGRTLTKEVALRDFLLALGIKAREGVDE